VIVRSVHLGFDVPGHAGATASVYYPADDAQLDSATLTGQVPPLAPSPLPVLVIVPGINVATDAYRWLAIWLVEAGFCAVTYAAIGPLGPAGTGITPGLDMTALTPDAIGTRPSGVAFRPLLAALGALAEPSPVAGVLDLDRVGLIGHSAGGTVALHNSRPDWVDTVHEMVKEMF